MITQTFTTSIQDVINKAQQQLSAHFQTQLLLENVSQLSEPDRRNVILRLHVGSTHDKIPTSFIIKKTTLELRGESEQEQMSRFARDWAGIEFLSQLGSSHAPHFYGGDIAQQFIIIEDLGEPHHSLVGPLTRKATSSNVNDAMLALQRYSQRVGQMHADTLGQSKKFEAILHKIYPHTLRLHLLNEKAISDVATCIKRHVGIDTSELHQELEDIHSILSTSNFNVLLHGDICPDNVYFQSSDMKMIDFEYGDMGHALIDGVYLRMSMPSCWCSKTLPINIVTKMESIYRAELKKKISAAADMRFDKAMVYACAFWAIRVINWHVDELMEHDNICPSGPVESDSMWVPEENAFRPRIFSRLGAFIDIANQHQQLPAFTRAVNTLLVHLQNKWPETRLMDHFPVFR